MSLLEIVAIDAQALPVLIGQALGFGALFFYVLSGQMKTGKMIMRTNSLACLVMAAHFALIGAPVAAAMVLGASIRSLLMSIESARRYGYLIVTCCVGAAAFYCISTAQAWWMLICIGGPVVWGIAEISGKEQVLRPLGLLSETFWLVNNILVFSLGGIISNVLVMGSYGLATWRCMRAQRILSVLVAADMRAVQRV